ncbi:MAG TPA: response regulator [bacterium]|jgi:two-component system response regulator|nr:response regulator [bacterium]
MEKDRSWIPIWVADDNQDDCRLLAHAFKDAALSNPLTFVHDGQQLLDALRMKQGPGNGHILPGLIILDMKMPVMDGKEALQAIRADPALCTIPVVFLTTSQFKDDILDGYRLGANSVVTKPFDYLQIVGLVTMLEKYWLEYVQLPMYLKME